MAPPPQVVSFRRPGAEREPARSRGSAVRIAVLLAAGGGAIGALLAADPDGTGKSDPSARPPVPDGVRLGIVRETYRATDGRERVAFVLAPPTGGTTATPGGEALPRAGGPSPARPLLILADPGGDASGIVSRYGDAALRHGWILASTPAVYNGTPDDADARELDALFAFVTSRHAIDRRRVVAGGFSGTGCTAYHEALLRPDRYRGAIAENAHTGYWDSMGSTVRPGGQSFYLFTRNADFNREPSRALLRGLVAAGFDAVLVEAAGDHQPMSPADADKALAWFERRWDGRCPHVAEPPVR